MALAYGRCGDVMSQVILLNTIVRYEIHCAKCYKHVEQMYSISHNSVLPLPTIPSGWREIGYGMVICGEHSITVEIDGEKF